MLPNDINMLVSFLNTKLRDDDFTTTPQMHCAACENKIKSNLRFEKGIKSIETSVPDQTVTVQYNADKTTPEKLQKGFEKFGYKARILKDGEKVEKNTGEKCDLM